jgi:hypothetical protein
MFAPVITSDLQTDQSVIAAAYTTQLANNDIK